MEIQNEIEKSLQSQKSFIKDFFKEDGFNQVIEAGKFIAVPHKGNNAKFYDEYVLNDHDFPLPDSKYYQAITEMSARLSNLVTKIKDYKDLVLDIEDTNLVKEDMLIETNSLGTADHPSKRDIRRSEIRIEKLENDLVQKQFSLGFIKSDIQEVYNEFIAWKSLVVKHEKNIKLPDFGTSRQAAMEIKKEIIRMTVDPRNAKGGEIPIIEDWGDLNKKIIEVSNSDLLSKYKTGNKKTINRRSFEDTLKNIANEK